MANKNKEKGTNFETYIANMLGEIYPDSRRTSAGTQSHDVAAGGIVVECKYREKWSLMEWITDLLIIARHRPWALICANREIRHNPKVRAVAIIPIEQYCDLLRSHERMKRQGEG